MYDVLIIHGVYVWHIYKTYMAYIYDIFIRIIWRIYEIQDLNISSKWLMKRKYYVYFKGMSRGASAFFVYYTITD